MFATLYHLQPDLDVALVEVQHHFAHVASVLADAGHGVDAGPVIGVALDGLGCFGRSRERSRGVQAQHPGVALQRDRLVRLLLEADDAPVPSVVEVHAAHRGGAA